MSSLTIHLQMKNYFKLVHLLRLDNYRNINFFHTSCTKWKRYSQGSGPRDPLHLYNYGNLVKEAEEYIKTTGTVPTPTLSGEGIVESSKMISQDVDSKLNIRNFKTIEQKYFKNLYRIKPGEKYSRSKDPFFQKIKTNAEFSHSHHFNPKNNHIKSETDPAIALNQTEKYIQDAKMKSPLNPVSLSNHLYNQRPISNHKNSTKYRNNKANILSPQQVYTIQNIKKRNSYLAEEEEDGANEKKEQSKEAFKNLGPNLLTFAMKEHMRYLYSNDPDNWSPEALSDIYPVTPAVAKKIVKSNWKPDSDRSLESHDLKVVKNWQKITNGKVNSLQMIETVIEKRKTLGSKVDSSVPAISPNIEQMEEINSKLYFEGLDVDVHERAPLSDALERKPRTVPRGGFWADIVKNSSVVKPPQITEDYKSWPPASESEVRKLLPIVETEGENWVKVRVDHQLVPRNGGNDITKSPITYEQFKNIKNDKLNQSAVESEYETLFKDSLREFLNEILEIGDLCERF